MQRKGSHRFRLAASVRLLPVFLALFAIALSSLHAGEVHAASDQSHSVQVQETQADANSADIPALGSGTHCTVNLTCHAPGLLAASPSVWGKSVSSALAWPETLFFHVGRTLTVPTPPPLAARA